jgi:predicted transcriptional regulator
MPQDETYHAEGAGQKRRSAEEIVADILRSSQRSISKTRIMYKAALNYKQLNKYLELLTKEGLLQHDPRSRRYRSSEKGMLYVERFEEFVKTREVIIAKSKALRELLTSLTSNSETENSE